MGSTNARLLVLIALLAVAMVATPASAVDRQVPSMYPTIQAAIDAAQPFDRVLVAPGIYRESIRVRGIPLTIESERGARRTTIDAGGAGRVVTFDPAATYTTVLQGFSITGGYVSGTDAAGAGVLIDGASPVLIGNVIAENRTFGSVHSVGAGVSCTSNAWFVDNEVRDNQATGTARSTVLGGAGIYASAGWFLQNRVTGNTNVSGADIGSPVLEARGAGAWLTGTTFFVNNRVIGNMTGLTALSGKGGGLYLEDSPIVSHNVILHNAAHSVSASGGGIFCAANSSPIIESNILIENFAQGDAKRVDSGQGGGIFVDSGATPRIAYNTIRRNRVMGLTVRGAGIAVNFANPTIVGCLLWENTHWDKGTAIANLSLAGVTESMIRYSLIGDGQFTGGNENLWANPGFRDAYHLAANSPCIDRGEPTNPQVVFTFDTGLNDRVVDTTGHGGRIDIGAQEYDTLRRPSRAPVRPGDAARMIFEAPAMAGERYLVAASLSPGATPVGPNDPRVIPIGIDPLVQVSLGQYLRPFEKFGGRLDSLGITHPTLWISEAPEIIGVRFHVAAVVLDSSNALKLISNRVEVLVE